jgi:hypothetical protein
MAEGPHHSLYGEDPGSDVPGSGPGSVAPPAADQAAWRRDPPPVRNADGAPAGRAVSDIAVASAKVAAIVEAAERAAEDLRLKTEQRARDRIAEADRAADLRVEAAEAEARDLLAAARRDAAVLTTEAQRAVQEIHSAAGLVREEAERRKTQALQEAHQEAARIKAEADAYADEVKRKAKIDARDVLAQAHDAARDVLRDGTELSGHLQELSESLRKNAERLLNDVRLAHGRLTADLDQATPAGLAPPSGSRQPEQVPVERPRAGRAELEVPEFIPPRP